MSLPLVCCRVARVDAGTHQEARVGVLLPPLRNFSIRRPLRAGEVRAAEVCPAEVRAAEVCPGEVRAGEVCPGEVRAVEVGAVKGGVGEVCPGEIRTVEVSPIEVRAVEGAPC